MAFWDLVVRDVMKENPITIGVEETIGRAVGVMREHDVSSLIVVGEGVLGSLCLRDILELSLIHI